MNFSVAWLMSSLAVSSVGFSVFLYGKKQGRLPQLLSGIGLMAIAGLVSSTALMWVTSGVVVGAMWLATRFGI